MNNTLAIIPAHLFAAYSKLIDPALIAAFERLADAEISTDTFSFYTSVASVFSSKIEGEEIELDSYIKHKRFGIEFQPDYTKKIDDLYDAYTFARTHALNREHVEQVHGLLGKNILAPQEQGRIRHQHTYVTTADGRIEYVAASPFEVETEMQKLYGDIDQLLTSELSFPEVFFYASCIHLVFVKIHPFNDGNGRTGRLLEKWFLAQKLGEKAWFIQSEQYYYERHQTYYHNLCALGLEYDMLDYSQALAFLSMLPESLKY